MKNLHLRILQQQSEEGIPSFNYKKVINKKSKFNFKIDEKINYKKNIHIL